MLSITSHDIIFKNLDILVIVRHLKLLYFYRFFGECQSDFFWALRRDNIM